MTEPRAGVVIEADKLRMEFVVTGTESDGELHQMRNHTDQPATVLWSTRPALRTGELFLALHEAAGDIERVVAVITEYDDVFCLADHPT